ncbi:MAG: hypothetical protein AB8B79_19050 [Granulosicoccus sp.]
MIYLLTQMAVALCLAALLGGAIGWLIHRSAHANIVREYHQGLISQQNHLNQAKSEIAMLSDDYDDMHRRTQEEIDALRQDNQQIPFLNTNLEKSQLLVRQMMQKHEAKVRDLTTENQKMSARLKTIDDRDQAYNKVQAELDKRQREKGRLSDEQSSTDSLNLKSAVPEATEAGTAKTVAPSAAASDPQIQSVAESVSSQNSDAQNQSVADSVSPQNDDANAAVSDQNINAKPSGSWASASLSEASETDDIDIKTIEIDADIDPFDNVMEVGDELQRELSDATLDQTIKDSAQLDSDSPEVDTLEAATAEGISSEGSAPGNDAQLERSASGSTIADDHAVQDTLSGGATLTAAAASGTAGLVGSLSRAGSATQDGFDMLADDTQRTGQAGTHTESSATEQLDFELSGADDDQLHHDSLLDGSSDASSLFEPVEQRDDLKQIFGIGPVTEKALNDMGITSYSQLADLKHHEIQSIADALQIVPGRIERDDWMGNARRQLEDVLEQL